MLRKRTKTAVLGRWILETDPSKQPGCDVILMRRCEVRPAAAEPDPDLEQAAAEFIARQVLDKDAVLFGG